MEEEIITTIEYVTNSDGTQTATAYNEAGEVVSIETVHTPFYDPQRMKLMQQLPQEEQ